MKAVFYGKCFFLLLLLALAPSACEKDEDPPEEPQVPSYDFEDVLARVPAGLKYCLDPAAQDCYSFIEQGVDMSLFIDYLEVPDVAEPVTGSSGSSWKWTSDKEGETFSYYWTFEEKQGKKYWYMDIQFEDGRCYDFINAWETMDGKMGAVEYDHSWSVISFPTDDESSLILWKFTWEKDRMGTYHLNLTIEDPFVDENPQVIYQVTLHIDGSGMLEYIIDEGMLVEMFWDRAGNGTWSHFYDGTLVSEGAWFA